MITDSLPDNWGWGVESITTDDNTDDVTVTTDDSTADDGEDYRGQDALADLYTPTLDDPAIDDSDDGFQGEDSWMDFDKSEDGEGARYDRDTNWQEDAALTFNTDVLNELTVPDMDFTEVQEEAFSERGQTLADTPDDVTVTTDDGDGNGDGSTPSPVPTLPDSWRNGMPTDGIGSSTLAIGAALIVAVGAVAYVGASGDE